MERIKHFADLSIRRGCGFGYLAIFTAMVGVSSHMLLAAKLGATALTLMCFILLLRAAQAPARSYKHTEVWILLDKRHDLPEARAQQVFGAILRECYLWHATVAASIAAFLWLLVFVLQFWGRGAGA